MGGVGLKVLKQVEGAKQDIPRDCSGDGGAMGMSVLESLARLAGGVQWGGVGRSTAGALSTGEIAAWWVGCDPFGTALCWARYAADGVAYKTALDEWTRRVEEKYADVPVNAYRWHWMAEGTLAGFMAGDSCRVCDGVGTTLAGTLLIACKACAGAGRAPDSQRQKLKRIGIGRHSSTEQRREWESRYDWCVSELDIHASRAAHCAGRNRG